MRTPTVLVIDDEETLGRATCEYFELFGWQAALALTGAGFWELWNQGTEPDLVLLDLNLPDGSVLGLCRRLRQISSVPVLVTTVRDGEEDVLAALSSGADDHIAKPYSLAVLLAKAGAMLRRTQFEESTPTQISLGDVTVRLDQSRVYGSTGEIGLTGTEWRLLEYLLRHSARIISKDELCLGVWGDNEGGDSRLATHIRRLREKIEPDPQTPRYLKTVWGTGYLLDTGGS